MEAPIPPPRPDDDEDVHWALSTAGALWTRGERTEALKWLRRAAEQASDVNADVRALELFKAAADVANKVSSASAPPPPPPPAPPAPSAPAPSAPQAAPVPQPKPSAPPAPPPRRPPPAPPPRAGSVYPPPPSSDDAAGQAARARAGTPDPASASRPPPPPPLRPPSIPAPPLPRMGSAAPPPPAARLPSPPGRTPPDVMPNKTVAQRPPAPPVAPPTRPVAITTAKIVSAPQALAPKRRRSFVGEPRPAERARSGEPAKGAPLHRKRGRTFQDEPTQARPLSLERPRAANRVLDTSSTFDDLDEDTRVLSTKGSNDLVNQAFERLRGSPVEPPPTPRAAPARDERSPEAAAPMSPGEGIVAEDTPDEHTVVGTPAFVQQEAAARLAGRRDRVEAEGRGAASVRAPVGDAPESPAPVSSSGALTERPPAALPAAPAPAAPGFSFTPAPARAPVHRLDTIPAVRVAVLATGTAGEVRLIALDGADDPPPGAALAILVPIGASDAEAVARLFASQD